MKHFYTILLFFLITCGALAVSLYISQKKIAGGARCSCEVMKKNLVVINVLQKELYDDCHIAGSISIPFDRIEQDAQASIDKDAEIVIYCSNYMCTASGMACKKLQHLGFRNVWAYEAGMAEWYQQGLPTQGPAKSAYLNRVLEQPKVHDPDVRVITTQELAAKMRVAKKIE